jgi:hypothetical protein
MGLKSLNCSCQEKHLDLELLCLFILHAKVQLRCSNLKCEIVNHKELSATLYLWNSTTAIATARLPSKAPSKEIDPQNFLEGCNYLK